MSEETIRLRDHAYSSFTEKLLARDIAPGQFVSQRELVELTGMPLGAIREMIPRLEADGLIRTSPKRGLQVLTIDLDLIREAFQLRRIIEGEAFAEFCDTATDADLARIGLAELFADHVSAIGRRRWTGRFTTMSSIGWATASSRTSTG